MDCPRLRHYVRLNQDGSVGNCGHMVNGRGFENVEQLHASEWSQELQDKMSKDVWPMECKRCRISEVTKGNSIRTHSIGRHEILKRLRDDYLIVGGVLNNVCNSACQSCNSGLSTKIGSLSSKNFPRINNLQNFRQLPQDRIVELDLNGGEPTASKDYRNILTGLPENVKIVRMNTNGSRTIKELEVVLKRGTTVIVTMSLDGTGRVHDYTRWPIKWENYVKTVDEYIDLKKRYRNLHLDFWTTVSCLNIENLPEIIKFAKEKNVPHDWAFLDSPDVLNVKYKNVFTDRAKSVYETVGSDRSNQSELKKFISVQDKLRKTSIRNYFNFIDI